jgi:uncharacterized protein (DUF433 family)
MPTKFDRITTNPEVMNGQPCVRGLRLTVRRVVEAVALYPDWEDLQAEYPELEKEDIRITEKTMRIRKIPLNESDK